MSANRSINDFINLKKYTKTHENTVQHIHYGYKILTFSNTSLDAKIKAFNVYLTANLAENDVQVNVDFNTDVTANLFVQLLEPGLKEIFKPSENGAILNYPQSTHMPIFYKFTYEFDQPADYIPNLKTILSAIHTFDHIDRDCLRTLYSFFQLPNPNPIDSSIIMLKRAYLKGAMFGLFSQKNLPRDLTNTISEYINENDVMNIVLTNKLAATFGTAALENEFPKIKL